MKKYLYLLFVALFATMSFSLTSCGDDDDEPNDPNNGGSTTESALTINGVEYELDGFFSQLLKSYDGHTVFSCQINNLIDAKMDISLLNWDSLSNGYVYSVNDDDIAVSFDNREDNYPCGHLVYGFTSGSVKVVSINQKANLVSLSFNNAKFVCDQDDFATTINGTITMPIKGHMYEGEMYD